MTENNAAEQRTAIVVELIVSMRDYFANAKTKDRADRVVKAIDAIGGSDPELGAAIAKAEAPRIEAEKAAAQNAKAKTLSILGVVPPAAETAPEPAPAPVIIPDPPKADEAAPAIPSPVSPAPAT